MDIVILLFFYTHKDVVSQYVSVRLATILGTGLLTALVTDVIV